jgi:PIN domain nuclease of toxin-antitoxin system
MCQDTGEHTTFDRLLIAQAQIEEAVLVSKDPIFSEYPLRVVW